MQMQLLRLRLFTFVAAVVMLAFSGAASADPPSRVARLGYKSGAVSLSPAGENDWVQATINRPLTTGDRLWADGRARAEIQVGGAMIRMNADTGFSILNLDDRIAQLQLTQGTLNVRVRRLASDQSFEVDTPNLAFILRQPGEYRIEVDPDRNETTIIVRQGQGEVYGEDASYVIDSRQPYRFAGTALRDYQYVDVPPFDEFDRWAVERDRAYDNSASARYVSQDVVGYQDLDANGNWRVDATYGNVWIPNRVAADWAPYRDGHWAWVDPWGWTWVDDASWGFAVSHYGRWANMSGTWGWVPGPVRSRAYYAPALVVFVGGNNFQLTISSGNVGGVAWFPLAPREVYRPSYPVSRAYFENANRSNTVINNTVINNSYNVTNVSNVVYANQRVPGAVVAVPQTVFVQSQPVSRAAVRVSGQVLASAPVAVSAPVAPTERSVRGAAGPGDKPPARVFDRPVVARTTPPAAHVGFAAQQPQLTAKPGQALGDAARKELTPAPAAPAPIVNVLTRTQTVPPKALPPAVAPAAKPGEVRPVPEVRTAPVTPPMRVSPPLTSPVTAQPQAAPRPATPPAPAAQTEQPRGQSEQRGNSEQRTRAVAPPAAPTQVPAQLPAPPRVTLPVPVAPPIAPAPAPRQPGTPETAPAARQIEPHAPIAAPRAPPQVAAPTQVPAQPPAPPRVTLPVPVAPPIAPAPAPRQPVKPEPAPAARQVEPHASVEAPKAPPQVTRPAPPAPIAEPRAQGARPGASKPTGTKGDNEEARRAEESSKPQR